MQRYKRVVIKIGTKVLTTKERALDADQIESIARQISGIRDKGIEAVLVTSGAIGAGMSLLNMKKRPAALTELQATAAVGQNHLMSLYSGYFREEGYLSGQMLLTQEDFNDRKRYLNIKHTINAVLKYKAIPVINENDTVATEEIKCGDNDRLSSLVADLCEADLLIILSDVDGLLDEQRKVIRYVHEITPKIMKLGGKSRCDMGTGGMATKLEASRSAMKAGIDCVIANGREKNVLYRIVIQGESIGTTFKSAKVKNIARKRWIAYSSMPKGSVMVDDGAKRALLEKDKSLLASGILNVEGIFGSGDVITITDKELGEIARGITNYSSEDISKIKGLKSARFKSVLGYKRADEVVHKDDLAIL